MDTENSERIRFDTLALLKFCLSCKLVRLRVRDRQRFALSGQYIIK